MVEQGIKTHRGTAIQLLLYAALGGAGVLLAAWTDTLGWDRLQTAMVRALVTGAAVWPLLVSPALEASKPRRTAAWAAWFLGGCVVLVVGSWRHGVRPGHWVFLTLAIVGAAYVLVRALRDAAA